MPMLKASEIRMVQSQDIGTVQDKINELLKDNWTLHGELKAVVLANDSGPYVWFIQPMVKLEMYEPGGGLGLNQGMPPILIPRG